MATSRPSRVSLFITCLVDQFHPEVGVGLVRVLNRLGIACDFPESQTCCGQPAFNSGCPDEARVAARQFLRAFRDAELIVAPSGSCAAMAKVFLPTLFERESPEHRLAEELAGRVHEFSEFLVNVAGAEDVGARFPHRVTYHDSCHLLRELNVRDEPRRLLGHVQELELVELDASDACCGFGGTFSIKYPDISAAMGDQKIENLQRSRARYVVANDTGCLMQLRGLLHRRAIPIHALHLAEVLSHGAAPRV
jgi:L-lactate dehydrogenase complex protein LldE